MKLGTHWNIFMKQIIETGVSRIACILVGIVIPQF